MASFADCAFSSFHSICAIFLKTFQWFWSKRLDFDKKRLNETVYVDTDDVGQPPKGPLIAFSSGGMLWAYYLGVIAFLRDHFDLHASNVRVSGISAGASAALILLLDLTIEQGFEFGLEWQKIFDQRPLKSWLLSTSEIVKAILQKMTKFGIDDKVLLAKYQKYSGSNTATFGVSALRFPSWRRFWNFRDHTFHMGLSNFASLKEMVYAGTCSMRILPLFRSLGFYGGHYVLDGAFTSSYSIPDIYRLHNMDKLDENDKVLRISVMKHKKVPGDIRPQQNFKFSDWIVCGYLDSNLEIFNQGYRDAATFERVMVCIKKGLKWNCPDINCPTIDSNEQDRLQWNAHIDCKIKDWNKSIAQYITTCNDE